MDKKLIKRIIALCCISVLVLGFYLFRFMLIQIVDGKDYQKLTQKLTVRNVAVKASRGEIVDRYGRPFAVNSMGFNIEFDYTFLPKTEQNKIIANLISLMKEQGEEWIDNLPLEYVSGNFVFSENEEDAISALKKHLRLQDYSTPDNVVDAMVKKYEIEGFTKEQILEVSAVRYEMEVREFSITNPYVFAEDISVETVTRIKEAGVFLSGVDAVETSIRSYVTGSIAPHIIGNIGPIYKEEYAELKKKGYKLSDYVGKSGIEKAYEDELKGTDGVKKIMIDSKGNVVSVTEVQPPQPGNTVQLTLDKNIQEVAAQALADKIASLNATAPAGEGKEADAGAAVAILVKSGEILAAVTNPSYPAEDYKKKYSEIANAPGSPLVNRAFDGQYTPGSTFKPLLSTAALNEGIIVEDSRVNCTGRYTFYGDYQPKCLSVHGHINVVSALQYSCNLFYYDTGRRLGIDLLHDYAVRLGFGSHTGLEIPEAIGQMTSKELREKNGGIWQNGDILQASIGQSDTLITPLQLANYVAAIADGGILRESHIVKSVNSYNMDYVIYETEPVIREDLRLNEGVVDVVKKGMYAASTIGTARAHFWNYPITVGSKTGTPETIDLPNSVFIAFAPVENPEIAVAVVIEKGWHGYTGAPVAKAIFNEYFFGSSEEEELVNENELLA